MGKHCAGKYRRACKARAEHETQHGRPPVVPDIRQHAATWRAHMQRQSKRIWM